jgi:23S rRNA pseudouridine2605 synthase
LPAPAPSFVEACMGSAQPTPNGAAIEQAQGWLTRLIASGTVVGLNLLGGVSEQPDFLAHTQALPYVLCLRADSDWKHAPQKSSGHKVSPLVLELWKALDKDGGLTAAQARETLGRELTEAAVLRALCELWQGLRISPVGDPGQPARWELLRVHHRDALSTASATGQVTALSLLVSMYLQSVYAASSEEIEIFLSPVASRSRVREAVRGLSATRQIHSLSMDAQTYYFLEEGLPELAEPAAPPVVRAEPLRPPAGVAARVESPRRPFPGTTPGQRKDQAARPARPASAPAFRPGRPSSPARPEPATGARGPRRPAAQWQPAAAPPGSRERGPGKPTGGAGRGAGAARPGVRPPPGDRAPSGKPPGAWRGPQKRERPAPWARPGQRAGSAPRPPNPEGRGDAPFRPAQRPRPRPAGPEGGLRSDSGRGASVAPGRPSSRASGRPAGRSPQSRSTSAANRPWAPGRLPGRSGPPRGGRPFSGPAALTSPGGEGRGQDRSSGRGAGGNDRPRPGGYAKSGANSGSGKQAGSSAPGSRSPGSRPPGSWPRAGTSARKPGGKPGGKPGKPPASFRGRKPTRRKPGV